MERQTILEFLRMVLIAFVIAFVINIFRVAIVGSWNDEPQFVNITEPEQDPQVSVNNYRTNRYPQSDTTINPSLSGEVVNIPIHQMEDFSGLSKNRIIEKRIDAMRTSPIFSHLNYYPSEQMFQITDGSPWISANAALHSSKMNDNEKAVGVRYTITVEKLDGSDLDEKWAKLFLVIDGENYIDGASLSDVIDVFQKYGAYNAANLDGGHSASLSINGSLYIYIVESSY